jgi:hypothetical protein
MPNISPLIKMKLCNNTCVKYNKLKTPGNDPSITKAMRYSQLVNSYKYLTVQSSSNEEKSYKQPLFTNFFSK